MAGIPPLRRLISEDFNDQSEWIGKLIQPLNEYFERTTNALNRRLTVNENMSGKLFDVTLDGNFPLKLSWELNAKPRSVLVGNVVKADGTSFTLATAVQVQWQFNQSGQLQIDGIVGVTPSGTTKYIITLEAKTN